MRDYVDPEGPDGWIKDPCPYCGAKSNVRCTRYGRAGAPPLPQPHASRERAWQGRRAKEQS